MAESAAATSPGLERLLTIAGLPLPGAPARQHEPQPDLDLDLDLSDRQAASDLNVNDLQQHQIEEFQRPQTEERQRAMSELVAHEPGPSYDDRQRAMSEVIVGHALPTAYDDRQRAMSESMAGPTNAAPAATYTPAVNQNGPPVRLFQTHHRVMHSRYATSADPRSYVPVYEYQINGFTIMIDSETGYVHITALWKALGNPKADVTKLCESDPSIAPHVKKIRGGYLKIQGTWLPFETALVLARRFAYPIRESLVPLFGPTFVDTCLAPGQPGYGQLLLSTPKSRNKTRSTSRSTVGSDTGFGAIRTERKDWSRFRPTGKPPPQDNPASVLGQPPIPFEVPEPPPPMPAYDHSSFGSALYSNNYAHQPMPEPPSLPLPSFGHQALPPAHDPAAEALMAMAIRTPNLTSSWTPPTSSNRGGPFVLPPLEQVAGNYSYGSMSSSFRTPTLPPLGQVQGLFGQPSPGFGLSMQSELPSAPQEHPQEVKPDGQAPFEDIEPREGNAAAEASSTI